MYFREPENKEEADRTAWDYYMYAGQIPKEAINRHTSKFLYKNPTAQRYATLGGAVSALLAGGLGAIVGSKFNRPGSGSIIGSLAGALGGGILGYRYGLKKDDEDRLNSYREWYNIQQEGDPSKAFPLLDPKELPPPDVFKQASVSNLNKISTQMNKKAYIRQTMRKQIIKQAFKLDDIKKWWKSLNSAKRDAIIGGGAGALGGGLLGGAVRGWRGAGLGALGGGALGAGLGYGYGRQVDKNKSLSRNIKSKRKTIKYLKSVIDENKAIAKDLDRKYRAAKIKGTFTSQELEDIRRTRDEAVQRVKGLEAKVTSLVKRNKELEDNLGLTTGKANRYMLENERIYGRLHETQQKVKQQAAKYKAELAKVRKANGAMNTLLMGKQQVPPGNVSNNAVVRVNRPQSAKPIVSNDALGISIAGPPILGLRQYDPTKPIVDTLPKGLPVGPSWENGPGPSRTQKVLNAIKSIPTTLNRVGDKINDKATPIALNIYNNAPRWGKNTARFVGHTVIRPMLYPIAKGVNWLQNQPEGPPYRPEPKQVPLAGPLDPAVDPWTGETIHSL